MGRSSHAAACLGYGGNNPQLLVTGGYGTKVLGDAWILDLQKGRWRRVRIHSCEVAIEDLYGHFLHGDVACIGGKTLIRLLCHIAAWHDNSTALLHCIT